MTRTLPLFWLALCGAALLGCTDPMTDDTGPEADVDADADTDTDTDKVTVGIQIAIPDIVAYYGSVPMPEEPTIVHVYSGAATPTITSDCDGDIAFGDTCEVAYETTPGNIVTVELERRDMVFATQTVQAGNSDSVTSVTWEPDQIYWNMCQGTYEDETGWQVENVTFGFADLNDDGRQVAYVDWLNHTTPVSGNFALGQGSSGRDELSFDDSLDSLIWDSYTATGELQEEIPMWCTF